MAENKIGPHSGHTMQVIGGTVEGLTEGMSQSQMAAELATRGAMSAMTLTGYTRVQGLETADMLASLKKAGDEVVGNDMSRVERTLANQFITLDAMFNDLAQRASQHTDYRGIETLMRLALKCQAQSRNTAEALAEIKNPTRFIGHQTNVAHTQQVNNQFSEQYAHTRAGGEKGSYAEQTIGVRK